MNKYNKYNSRESLFVISLYPKRGETYSAATSGIASYAKNIVKNLHEKVIVLADFSKSKDTYEEGNALILRCFKKNSPLLWISLLKNISYFRKVKNILVHFDFALYGSIKTSIFFLPFLALLKSRGYKVSVVSHSVIDDVKSLSGHLGIDHTLTDRMKIFTFNKIFRLFYRSLGILSEKVILNEQLLVNTMVKYVDREKISVIPHGVDTSVSIVPKENARQILGIPKKDFVVMFFGFVNWFKGADFFAQTFSERTKILNRNARFIIAGGESATMGSFSYYHKYFESVKNTVQRSKKMFYTGYVNQAMIKNYFAACDLVVFPYRSFISASGVMSLVFSYKKPFVVSETFEKMFESNDLKSACGKYGLKKEDFVFSLSPSSCVETTENVLINGIKSKMVNFSDMVRQERSFEKTARQYENLLFAKDSDIDISKINFMLAYDK